MSDNDLTVTLSAKVDQALAGLAKVGAGIDKLTEKQHKLKESSEGFGAKTVLAFEAVHHGAEKALEFAEKVAHAIAEIDKNLAKLSQRGGASNIALSQTLTGLGIGGESLERTQRLIRGQQGTLNQSQLDAFTASLGNSNERLTGQRTSQLAGVASRVAPIVGNLDSIGELQHIFGGQLGASDIGDLAVRYSQSVPGGFSGDQAKGVHELIGAGVDPYQALAIAANFNRVGEKKGISALASYLQSGGTLKGAFAGRTGEAGLDRAVGAVVGSGGGLGSIANDAAKFRAVTSSDVTGDALAGLPESTKREIELRRGARGFEINRNNAADRGIGTGAREDIEQVEDAIASLEEAGEYAQAFALKQQVEKYGPGYAASNLRKTSGGHVEDAVSGIFHALRGGAAFGIGASGSGVAPGAGPLRPVKVEIHNANPAHD